MKNILNLLIVFFIMVGCASKHKPVLQNEDSISPSNLVFSQEQKLSSHPVKLNIILNDPMQLVMADSLLLIRDYGERLVKVFDPVRERILTSICRKGRGPGEFTERMTITYNKNDNAINTYEEEVRIFTHFHVAQALNWANDSVKKVNFDKSLMQQLVKCNDSLFIGVGLFEKRYALFKPDGKFLRVKYDYPDLPDNDLPFGLKSIAYQGNLVVNSTGNRFIAASLYCDNIEFFEIIGADIKKIKVYQSYLPDLDNKSNGNQKILHPKEGTKFGYLDISAQGNHIYCLYSGKTIKESRGKGGPFHGSTIRVFDIDGNPVVSYSLDRDVFKFTVDSQEKTIYAIVHNPEPEIVKFRL